MTATPPALDDLRRDIDRIDDALHDLLVRRSEVVASIRAAKSGGFALRPAREAAILRRLLARHAGAFPRESLVRIWREIMGAMVRLQGSFTIAAPASVGAEFLALAREEYGSTTTLTTVSSARHALGAVRAGEAALALLPLPRDGEAQPWWPLLADTDGLRIVARLPFAAVKRRVEALAVARLDLQASGEDRTLLALAAPEPLSRAKIQALFQAAGLAAREIVTAGPGSADGTHRYAVDTDGFLAPGEPGLTRLTEAAKGAATVSVLGAYPVPLDAARLAPASV
jgi:chorismate mutase